MRALVSAGAVYYSDEFAVLDETGRVHPYPKRLSLRNPDGPTVDHRVEELGGVAGDVVSPVGMVILTSYRPGVEWRHSTLSTGAAVGAILEHAVSTQDRPEQTMRVVRHTVKRATVLQGERGEADEFAGILLDILRSVA